MASGRRLRNDVAKLATGAVGLMQGAGREAEGLFRLRLERLLERMDLVRRDEFEAVRAMAEAARAENERLADRLAKLEAAAAAPAKRQARPRGSAKRAKPKA